MFIEGLLRIARKWTPWEARPEAGGHIRPWERPEWFPSFAPSDAASFVGTLYSAMIWLQSGDCSRELPWTWVGIGQWRGLLPVGRRLSGPWEHLSSSQKWVSTRFFLSDLPLLLCDQPLPTYQADPWPCPCRPSGRKPQVKHAEPPETSCKVKECLRKRRYSAVFGGKYALVMDSWHFKGKLEIPSLYLVSL